MIFLHLLTHIASVAVEGTIDNNVVEITTTNQQQFIVEDISKNEYFKQEQKNALKNMCFGKLEIFKFRTDEYNNWWTQYDSDFKVWQESDYYKKYEAIYDVPPWVYGGNPTGYTETDKDRLTEYHSKTQSLLQEIEEGCSTIFLVTDKL